MLQTPRGVSTLWHDNRKTGYKLDTYYLIGHTKIHTQ